MGLHTGEPVSETQGYVGLDVHRAARICSAGHGGQILLSHAVEALAAPDLPSGTSLRDLGTHRLRDLQQPEHLLQVVHPDLPADFPPLKSLDVLPNNLPIQLTSFIGREREKVEVKRLLSASRFLTLTGSGGAGKTRLALQVAAEALEGFPDGVWLVELAALSDPSLVPKMVASALDVPEQPGRALTGTLADSLRGKSVLVILDNCEHLVAACAHLTTALLRACPRLRILATSREALGVAGETTWRVPSLSIPDPQCLPSLDRLTEYEAVRLFIDRALASAPQFAVTSGNAAAVAQVCHRLDGIPLALELAAARVKVLAVEQIAARLDDRFRLLTGGSRTALPRQQTLRAAMDWSYDLLSQNERAVLQRLSVFVGGCTLEAAEAVCVGDSVEASAILDFLTQLVDKSLVVAETQGGEARYRLLETVRRYGLERLMEAGRAADSRRRHRDWYLALAEQAEPELLGGPLRDSWLERLETEHDNLRAALQWSKAERDGAEAGLRLAGVLFWFWHTLGHWSEGRGWMEGALIRSSDAPVSSLPKVLYGAAQFAWRQGDDERAIALSEQGLALSRELGDNTYIFWCLNSRGVVALRQGRYDQALALYEESLVISRRIGDKGLYQQALSALAVLAIIEGDHDWAAGFCEEALALARADVGTRDSRALRNQGLLAMRQHNYKLATGLYAEGLVLCTGRKSWVAEDCLEGFASAASGQGNFERGTRLFAAAEALREILGRDRLPPFQTEYDRRVASARAALGDAAFSAAWADGRAMTLEQAIEYALQEERGIQ
jgi:predicted ATPase